MEGSQQQQFDWETPFRERMNELRARLRSVEVAVLRLSLLRWDQVVEVIMAIWAHTQPTGECRTRTERVMETSGLTRRQYYTALAEAKKLGLVAAMMSYAAGGARQSDRLRIDLARIDELVRRSRHWRHASGNQREPAGTSGNQREPAGTSSARWSNTRGCAGAAEELLNNLSSSSSERAGGRDACRVPVVDLVHRTGEEEVEDVESLILDLAGTCRRRFAHRCPMAIDAALRQAVAAGCTIEQLRARCRWFAEHQYEWSAQHAPGVLYRGLADATPDLEPNWGWPYRS